MGNTVRMSSELVGQVLGDRYKIEQKIGSGGFAIVYRAKDTRIGKYVAVKVLDREKVRSVRDIGRFRNEAAIAAAIDDDHIVKVTDYGEEEGRFYFVMELLRGHSLRQMLVLTEKFTWRRACDVGAQICDALEQAHQHKIIHRDIKPENVFLETRRGVEHVKVLDLGIAKVLQEGEWDGLAQNLSHTGDFVGSPSYMAPEQAKGPRHCDTRVDIYALGVVLYELVTGDVPFRGNTAWETVLMHVEQPPPPMAKKVPGLVVPAVYEALVMRALAKDPAKRFATVTEMAAALRALLAVADAPAVSVAAAPVPAPAPLSPEPAPEPAPPDVAAPVPAAEPQPPAPVELAEPETHRLPRRPALAPTQESVPSRSIVTVSPAPQVQPAPPPPVPVPVPVASVQPSPLPLPLRWRTRFFLGYMMVGSLIVTCTFGTTLAMTIDTEWLDGMKRGRKVRMLDPVEEDRSPPRLAVKALAPPPAEPQSPFERLLLAPPDDPAPEAGAAPEPRKKPARPAPRRAAAEEVEGPLLDTPRKLTMAAIARRAAVVIKETCKITAFSPLKEARYEIVFHVDPANGSIQQISAVGDNPPLRQPDCVRDRARAIVASFAGAADIQPEYRHSYAVVR